MGIGDIKERGRWQSMGIGDIKRGRNVAIYGDWRHEMRERPWACSRRMPDQHRSRALPSPGSRVVGSDKG
jgi:hypothetical protein